MRTSGRRITSATLAACLTMLLALPSIAEVLEGMPDVIVCTVVVPNEEHGVLRWVYYISSQQEGVHTRYNTMGGRSLPLKIDNKGTVIESTKSDCENKTVDQLKAAGQVFSFNKP